MSVLRAVKGMNDVLPDEVGRWQRLEAIFARIASLYGFAEVRTPYVEPTGLFVRTIGEATDVVEKEMYSFARHDESLTLRPEGTAGAARAYVEHAIHGKETVTRWYYVGPMFRGERPARGRYRQFSQAGAEIFGDPGPGCDAELIDMLVAFLGELGIGDAQVSINSLGSGDARARYRDALTAHLTPLRASLSDDSQRRLASNPLRILDSKDPRDREQLQGAPLLGEFLSVEDQDHFDRLRRQLDVLGIAYAVDPKLVRGLDYYTRTLFEIKGATAKLGAGDTLVGGGRYDRMIAELGGPEVPSIGFAAGLERLLIASELAEGPVGDRIFVATLGARAAEEGLVLARDLRRAGMRVEVDTRGHSLKSQLRRANTMAARVALILGDSEVEGQKVVVKDLAGHGQTEEPRSGVVAAVGALLATPAPRSP